MGVPEACTRNNSSSIDRGASLDLLNEHL